MMIQTNPMMLPWHDDGLLYLTYSMILYDASKLWWYDDEHVDEAYSLMIHCLMMSDECPNAKFWSSRQLASFLCPIYIQCYLVEDDDDLRQDMTCWWQQRASVLMSRLTSRVMMRSIDEQGWWVTSRWWAEKFQKTIAAVLSRLTNSRWMMSNVTAKQCWWYDRVVLCMMTVSLNVKASLSCFWG